MTARFKLEGPYGFSGAENAAVKGETRSARQMRDTAFCANAVARAEMDFLRAHRRCPDGACRRARRCMGPEFSCRVTGHRRLIGFLEEGAAIDYAVAELQHARQRRSK